ncbi:MAG: rhodanese-like domain-containing protein [Cyclobacteriaceae bacterium]|nr:rhodanese-like domain-containing protein [Cyclobacteriaceae bacterium]
MKINTLLYVISLVVFAFGCDGQTGVQKLSVDNFEKKLAATSDKIVLDVRTKDEYKSGHLATATVIDYYSSDFKNQANQLDKTKPVFVYCAAGVRSDKAVKILTQLGFKEIYDLQGGFNAWTAARKPVQR